jgi:hypothetical protein
VRRWIGAWCAAALVAGCGQIGDVHRRFVAVYTQPIAVSTTAHGASARTRVVTRRTTVFTGPQHVPGGTAILVVPPPTRGPNGELVVTWPQWAALLLDRLHAPRCANNLIVMVAWAQQENTLAGWNPLATTYDEPGATLFNSAGVKNYVSLYQGLDATVGTLRLGFSSHGYGAIVQDLRVCADPVTTATAINASDWCRGCSGGAYVLGTVAEVIRAYVASQRK